MLAPILIQAGKTESEPFTLAHFTLAAVAVESKTELTLRFLASFDGKAYYKMHKADGRLLQAIVTDAEPLMLIFDCTDFEGPQFIKFLIDQPLKEDLSLTLWKKEIRA